MTGIEVGRTFIPLGVVCHSATIRTIEKVEGKSKKNTIVCGVNTGAFFKQTRSYCAVNSQHRIFEQKLVQLFSTLIPASCIISHVLMFFAHSIIRRLGSCGCRPTFMRMRVENIRRGILWCATATFFSFSLCLEKPINDKYDSDLSQENIKITAHVRSLSYWMLCDWQVIWHRFDISPPFLSLSLSLRSPH